MRTKAEPFAEMLKRSVSRRSLVRAAGAAVPLAIAASALGCETPSPTAVGPTPAFVPIQGTSADTVTVAPGYAWHLLISWGDPVLRDAPTFDVANQSAAAQAKQFGYNCDFLAFMPLPDHQSTVSDRGLLWNNHEYTNPELMFSNWSVDATTREIVDIELAAHGASVVEIRLIDGRWTPVATSVYNRRLTALTPMTLAGPAAGDARLQTSADPTGTQVLGMLSNCGGGVTPWGTILTDEENFQDYFGNRALLPDGPRQAAYTRYELPAAHSERRWEEHYDRFDIAKEPNEANRFGYVVEVDPYDPDSTPIKHTALGRFRHEASTVVTTPDRRAVVYSGDDARFEYVYKFISTGRYSPDDRAANFSVLDDGLLYAAKFHDDGAGEWLPLEAGAGELAEFSAADIAINTRLAGDAVGATPMDRPEDIEWNPVNGKVYATMTENKLRTSEQVDAANPRAENLLGHVIEITETGNDPASTTFDWEIFILGGDPANPDHAAFYAGIDPSLVSPLANPDNVLFDQRGTLYVCTDEQSKNLAINDGLYAIPVAGPDRGRAMQLLSVPVGAELASAIFTPDNRHLFGSAQHPGEGSTYAEPTSDYPDGDGRPPRPGVFAVRKLDGGVIGT